MSITERLNDNIETSKLALKIGVGVVSAVTILIVGGGFLGYKLYKENKAKQHSYQKENILQYQIKK